jgi:hypothetical protein
MRKPSATELTAQRVAAIRDWIVTLTEKYQKVGRQKFFLGAVKQTAHRNALYQ